MRHQTNLRGQMLIEMNEFADTEKVMCSHKIVKIKVRLYQMINFYRTKLVLYKFVVFIHLPTANQSVDQTKI